MGSFDLESNMTVEDACAILRRYPGADVADIPGGIGLGFGEDRVAWVGDGEPDVRTHVVIKDWSETVAWDLFDHLAAHTAATMSLTDYGGILVRERLWPDPSGARAGHNPVDWDRRVVAARVVTEAIRSPISSATLYDIMRDSGVYDPSVAHERCRDLAGPLIRHGLLVPGDLGPDGFRAWPEDTRDSVSRLHRAWPSDPAVPDGAKDAFWLAPARGSRTPSRRPASPWPWSPTG